MAIPATSENTMADHKEAALAWPGYHAIRATTHLTAKNLKWSMHVRSKKTHAAKIKARRSGDKTQPK